MALIAIRPPLRYSPIFKALIFNLRRSSNPDHQQVFQNNLGNTRP